MATRGPKYQPSYLKLLKGTQRGPIPPEITVDPGTNNQLDPPKRLRKRELAIWNEFIRPLHWLKGVDAPLAMVWVSLYAEFERSPGKMIAGRIAQMRAAGSEIGLTPSARTRMEADGVAGRSGGVDVAAKYLRGPK